MRPDTSYGDGMTEPLSTHPRERPRKTPPEIIGARVPPSSTSSLSQPGAPLLRFTIVTAVCTALVVVLVLTIGWL
jgi:hypothetical protein